MENKKTHQPNQLRRYLPCLGWLPKYDRTWLSVDIVAGLTLWGLVVPQAMAYAGIAGLPPQAGLYTLVASLLIYALMRPPATWWCRPLQLQQPCWLRWWRLPWSPRPRSTLRSGDLSGVCIGIRPGHRPDLSGGRPGAPGFHHPVPVQAGDGRLCGGPGRLCGRGTVEQAVWCAQARRHPWKSWSGSSRSCPRRTG